MPTGCVFRHKALTVPAEADSSRLKFIPIQAKLPHNCAQSPRRDILRSPVRQDGGAALASGNPLPVRVAAAAWKLFATKRSQLASGLAISHAAVMTSSTRKGELTASIFRLAGSVLPVSS